MLVVALLAAAPLVRAGNKDCEDCPTVVGIVGRWVQVDPQSDGEKIKFGETMKMRNGSADVACDEGTLALLRGKTVTAYHCLATAAPQTHLPEGTKYLVHITPAAQDGWSNAFAGPFIEHVTPVSRGLEPELSDAVVSIKGDNVDLTASFQGMDSGSYRIRLEPVSGGKATIPAPVKWTDGDSVSLSIPELRPGLYRLGQLDANGRLAALEAWILVSRPEDFEKNLSVYQEALDATKRWPDEVDIRAPRAFLRQVLEGLSRRPVR